MGEDIQVGYPTGYYDLKRRVSKEIGEVLQTWSIRASTDHPVTKEQIDEWVRLLSVRSGIPRKGIAKLFTDINPRTKEWFL